LTVDQRKAALKGRPGGNEIADRIGGLAGKYHVVIPNMTLADMQADQTLAARLQPLREKIGAFAQLIDDTVLQAQAECWRAVTTYYNILDSMSAADATLRTEL